MRPYTYNPKYKGFTTGGVTRPTRNAAGMTYTSDRSNHGTKSDSALHLKVCGTCDQLKSFWFYTSRSERLCPCCGQRTLKRGLSNQGRTRLRYWREGWRTASKPVLPEPATA